MKARWLALLLFSPLLLISFALIPVVILGVVANQASSAGLPSGQIAPVIAFLTEQLGEPYSASVPDGPDSWDCSGLVTGAYHTIGIDLPSLTFDQDKLGNDVPIDPTAVRPGDALFMRGGNPVTDLGHVGVAISATEMISAPAPGSDVHVSPIPWGGIQSIRRYVTAAPVLAGSWDEFLAAHYETSGVVDPNATLTGVQIAVLFYDAGCRGVPLAEFVAISGRESGWNPTAFNFHADSTGDISLGLVQENVKGGMVARLGEAGLSDPRQLFNPVNAAHAAFLLSDSCTDLRPWGGYKGLPNTYGTDMAGAIAAVTAARNVGLIGADA